jgi:hypothetical protein
MESRVHGPTLRFTTTLAISIHPLSATLHVKHVERLKTSTGWYDTTLSEDEVSVSSSPKVLQFTQTTAIDDYGFQGWKTNPRNLTLTLDSNGMIYATIASLKQSHNFIYDHQENEEKWACQLVSKSLEELAIVAEEMQFCSYSTYTSVGSVSTGRSNVVLLQVTGTE